MPLSRSLGGSVPAVSVSNDEIFERYLQRAIRELNDLQRELGALADETHVPVLGSGHPLPDVFLLKHHPVASEIAEGVAFFGRAGEALIKSMERLQVDPTAVYGTNCLKFGTEEPELARGWLTRELHITQPKLVVAMGDAAVAFLNELAFPLSRRLDAERPGELQPFTPTIEALVTPDIDTSLDEQDAKNRFWEAFRQVGPWWASLPPY
jgi:uracil-DNA glycosylase family 4